jgi:hypothetical protein
MTENVAPTATQFLPYGIMNNEFLKNLGAPFLLASPGEPEVPPDFCPLPENPGVSRQQHWRDLRKETLEIMRDVVWPLWDEEHLQWHGRARDIMLPLTLADLEILLKLRTGPGPLAINTVPDSRPRAINCPLHFAFFKEEDPGNIFQSYAFYDRTLDPKLPQIFAGAFFAGLAAKCSSTQLQFKTRFQRPRAYQMALLLRKPEFNLEEAVSSMSPSMVSGHSLQGLVGVGAVMERILQSGMSFSGDSWQALRQYAVDIGDRRVMAGVHYPSDNLGSWIVLMRLARRIFRVDGVKQNLWQAIEEQSLIYRLVLSSPAEVYAPVLDLLHRMRDTD